MSNKLKLGLYWAASCGGCEITVLDLHEKILDVAAIAEILFWPVALDFKYADVEAMPDRHIDVCLFNGAIRNSEQEHMAKLLRAKSKALVAFGSCAHLGGIPGLANVTSREAIFDWVYRESPSTENASGTLPRTRFEVPEGELTLPAFYNSVRTLGQTVPVDYFVPGCPPTARQVWNIVQAIANNQLPPPGSVIGANDKTVCEECSRIKQEKRVSKFHRPYEVLPDPERCLLEQGIVCLGPATRGGCEAQCLKANMPCRGCYGPTAEVADQGAKLLSAVASVIDAHDEAEARRIVEQIPDPLGTAYRFSLPSSQLFRVNVR